MRAARGAASGTPDAALLCEGGVAIQELGGLRRLQTRQGADESGGGAAGRRGGLVAGTLWERGRAARECEKGRGRGVPRRPPAGGGAPRAGARGRAARGAAARGAGLPKLAGAAAPASGAAGSARPASPNADPCATARATMPVIALTPRDQGPAAAGTACAAWRGPRETHVECGAKIAPRLALHRNWRRTRLQRASLRAD